MCRYNASPWKGPGFGHDSGVLTACHGDPSARSPSRIDGNEIHARGCSQLRLLSVGSTVSVVIVTVGPERHPRDGVRGSAMRHSHPCHRGASGEPRETAKTHSSRPNWIHRNDDSRTSGVVTAPPS